MKHVHGASPMGSVLCAILKMRTSSVSLLSLVVTTSHRLCMSKSAESRMYASMLSPVLLALCLRFLLFISDASAQNQPVGTPSNYWVANVQRQGIVTFGNASYPVFRNVKAYGAKGQSSVCLDSLNKADILRRWHDR